MRAEGDEGFGGGIDPLTGGRPDSGSLPGAGRAGVGECSKSNPPQSPRNRGEGRNDWPSGDRRHSVRRSCDRSRGSISSRVANASPSVCWHYDRVEMCERPDTLGYGGTPRSHSATRASVERHRRLEWYTGYAPRICANFTQRIFTARTSVMGTIAESTTRREVPAATSNRTVHRGLLLSRCGIGRRSRWRNAFHTRRSRLRQATRCVDDSTRPNDPTIHGK